MTGGVPRRASKAGIAHRRWRVSTNSANFATCLVKYESATRADAAQEALRRTKFTALARGAIFRAIVLRAICAEVGVDFPAAAQIARLGLTNCAWGVSLYWDHELGRYYLRVALSSVLGTAA